MYTEGKLIPSLPSIQRQFGVSESMVSWVLSLYLAFGTVSAAILGKLGDIYGKKRMMIVAISIYIL
jgi:Major Facilitator Superfamily.